MREEDYYPPGAYYDSNAPYNQVETPEIEVDMVASFIVQRKCTILTDYVYPDEYGWTVADDVDLDEEYHKNYHGIPALMDMLVEYVNNELSTCTSSRRKYELLKIRDSAVGWNVIETDHEQI